MSSVNESHKLLASAARTATVTGDDQVNTSGVGLRVVIDATASADTPSVVPKIQGKTASGVYYTLLEGAAITGTTTVELLVFPGAAVTANVSANKPLPRVWRLVMTAADADSLTYAADFDVFSMAD